VSLLLVLGFNAYTRLRLESLPLERDEGEYAYAGQLLLEGVPPYELAYNMKLPGTYLAYAGLMWLFGQTTEGIHRGLLVVTLCTSLLVYSIARRLVSQVAGVFAAAAYVVMAVSPSVLGVAAHATHFVVLPVLVAVRLLLARRSHVLGLTVLAGAFVGVGVLMKQQGAAFVPLGVVLVVLRDLEASHGCRARSVYHSLAFIGAASLPFALTCLWLYWAGVFGSFWFWTIRYAREYASLVTLEQGLEILGFMFPRVVSHLAPLWILGALGLCSPLWSRVARARAVAIGALTAFSFLAVCPGFYF
jgi:4-amino-4-deoxy-L-arabinose transferase-like glycosyltransferase